MKKISLILLISCLSFLFNCSEKDRAEYDLVIYGGTSSAVIAAVQAAKMDATVAIVCPDTHLGGMTSGGLGWTDGGNNSAIGGLARDFYRRIYSYYQNPDIWKWQKKSDYGNIGQGAKALNDADSTGWVFEPHVAESVFESFITEYKIAVYRDEWLDRKNGVKTENGRITEITTLSGKSFAGKMFIDATYEGDLLASAGVTYTVGREASTIYDEEWNGVQKSTFHHGHYFAKPVDPYITSGDPSSGLLARISAAPPGEIGQGDHRIQAYCYRMCLTQNAENRVPFSKPDGYDPSQYELILRVFDAGWRQHFQKFDPIPNNKTDTNNHGPFSTDNIGYNYDYPEASYERRAEILKEHQSYQKGLMYFLATDSRVPQDVQTKFSTWGLAKDEFTDNGHWPHQIYVREARRMVSDYVMTEHDVLARRNVPKPVGMGSYTMDSHNVQRYVTPEGTVQNEGDLGVKAPAPYRISYDSIVPKKQECENLFAPVCLSSSHIAYGSIRMEPVFMILGQSAATAAVFAIRDNIAIQDVNYEKLRERLIQDKQRF
jgi:hypothetical protein